MKHIWPTVTLFYMTALAFMSFQPASVTRAGLVDIGAFDWIGVMYDAAHFPAYMILMYLLSRWLGDDRLPLALTVSITYGICNEFFQSFVPGRSSSLEDIIVNSFGSVFVYALIQINKKSEKAGKK